MNDAISNLIVLLFLLLSLLQVVERAAYESERQRLGSESIETRSSDVIEESRVSGRDNGHTDSRGLEGVDRSGREGVSGESGEPLSGAGGESGSVILPATENATEEKLGRSSSFQDRVSYCESGQSNINNPISSASGYFQFIDSTWEWVTELEPPAINYPLEIQIEAFETLWDEGRGASHWEESRYCWDLIKPWETHDR